MFQSLYRNIIPISVLDAIMDAQQGCGLSCTLLSLHSESSHLIGQHSAVQPRLPPLHMSPRQNHPPSINDPKKFSGKF